MIYVDDSHMTADTLGELHKFANFMGMKRAWFNGYKYELLAEWRWKMAIDMGAKLVTSKELIDISFNIK